MKPHHPPAGFLPVLTLSLQLLASPAGAAPLVATAISGPNEPSTPTDEVAFAAAVSSSDLLHGVVGTGGIWLGNGSSPAGLNDGAAGGDFDALGLPALNGAAWSADGNKVSFREFVLGSGTGGFGYDISGIQSIAAWSGAGFSNQKYEVRVRLAGEVGFPVDPLLTVDYQPFGTSGTQGGSTKVNITDDSSLLASGVVAIRFDILDTNSNNAGGAVLREIDVFGTETLDIAPPQITALVPSGTGVYPGAGLAATFNENIALTGGGSITLVDTGDGSDSVAINVADPSQVSVAGSKLIINPPANLAFNTPFEVVIGGNTVRDSAGTPNVFAGTTSGQWIFTTAAEEFTAPLILSTTPGDGASRVSLSGNLVATFNQNLVAGSGDIAIIATGDGSTSRTIAVTDSTQVSISGAVLTIDPAARLAGDRKYAIQIAPGAVKNHSDLGFGGIANSGDWDFSTVPFVIHNFPDGSDVATGISSAKTYTHLIDFGKDADTAVINGVSFDNTVGAYTFSSPNTYGAANPLNGASPGSGMRHLLDHFRFGYNGVTPPTLTLSGLTPGVTYKLRLYVSGWGPSPQTFSFDDTAPVTVVGGIPRSAGQDLPSSLDYTYTLGAGDTDLTVTVTPEVGNDSFHWYGFSNEVAGGNTFADWIASYPGVGGQTGVDQDPDGDGIDSGVENYFGTDPSKFSRGIVAGGVSGNTFTFTHPINAVPAGNLAAAYRWSTNLQEFHDDGSPDGAGTTTVNFSKSPPSGGQVTVTATLSGSVIPDRLFVDVRVN